MNRDEKRIARIMFKLKVHESDGQKYEDLFVQVMGKANPHFSPVKAYGNIGDMKNDGFDKTTGTYYQVFAPENVEKKQTISDAVTKLREDFDGLQKHWQSLCPIREFFYVVNDKYKGVPAPIHQELLQLGKENPDTTFAIFAAKNLEDVFLSLSDDDIVDVVDIPSARIDLLDYSALDEAIQHIMTGDGVSYLSSKLTVPDFDEKIQCNELSDHIKTLLTYGSYQTGDLEQYFGQNSEYARNELQHKFREMYEESKRIFPSDTEDYSDQRFMYILQKACPKRGKVYSDAVLVLMSFYFESCDIFEQPIPVKVDAP